MTKMLIMLFILSLSSLSFAKHHEEKGKNFEAKKAKAIEVTDKRIQGLQKLKSCLSSASNKDALKACRKNHKSMVKEHRHEMKKRRAERKKNKK